MRVAKAGCIMRNKLLRTILIIFISIVLAVCAFQKGWCSDLQKNEEAIRQATDELSQTKRLFEDRLAQEIKDKQVGLQVMGEGLVITVISDVLFDASGAKIRQEGFPILDKVAYILKENVPHLNVVIEGHTDNQPVKLGWKSNWELSVARASSILRYLVDEKGIPSTRTSAIGFGEKHPIASNDTEEGRKLNQRIEIAISPQVTKTKETKAKETKIPIAQKLLLRLLFGNLDYDAKYEYPIPLDKIQFKLSEKQDKGCYEVNALYIKGKKTVEYFGGHYINIYGSKSDSIGVFRSALYYNPKNNILYVPFSGGGKRRYYILGKGELANGKFKPYFLEGTKFNYHPRQHSQLDTSSIIIYMPKPGYELMVEENN